MRHERRIAIMANDETGPIALQYCIGCGATWEPISAWDHNELEQGWDQHLEEINAATQATG